jgi:urea-proton symporter
MLSGNLIAILSSTVIHYVYSKFIDPQNFDFAELDNRIALVEEDLRGLSSEDKDPTMLAREETWVKRRAYGLTLVLVIIWPVAALPAGVFSQAYFSFWVSVSMIWGAIAAIFIVTLPMIESWNDVSGILRRAYCWTRGFVGEKLRRRQVTPHHATSSVVSDETP